MEKSWSRQQLEAERKKNPRRGLKASGEFRNIPPGSENEIQALFFKWVAANQNRFPELEEFYAVPNGSFLTKFGRYVGSITGRKSGVPDTHLPWPSHDNQYRSLWIEFKTKTGSTSPEQKRWIARLREAGSRVEVMRSWTEAANLTIEHLNMETERVIWTF